MLLSTFFRSKLLPSNLTSVSLLRIVDEVVNGDESLLLMTACG
jgi:hypothetical protein